MNSFLIAYNSIKIKTLLDGSDLKLRELIVLILIIGLYERNNGTLSKFQVVRSNRAINGTTYSILKALEQKGFITSKKESNHFFAKSYISLTQKGLTFKRELNKLLNTPIALPDE